MKWLRNSSFCSLNLIQPIIMSPHSERHHSLYCLTINYSQQEYLKLELPNLRWMYATKAQPLTITFLTFLSQDYDDSEARITQPTKAINEERRFDKLRLRYENISKLKIIVFGLSDSVCAGIMTDQLIIFSNIQHRGVGNKSLIHILRA